MEWKQKNSNSKQFRLQKNSPYMGMEVTGLTTLEKNKNNYYLHSFTLYM